MDVGGVIDAVESWLAGQSFWVQVPIVLAVLIPVGWLVAGLIDRLVERILWLTTRREARAAAAHPAGRRRPLAEAGAVTDHQAPGPDSGPRT